MEVKTAVAPMGFCHQLPRSSLGLAASGVVALTTAWIGLVVVWRTRRHAPPRGLYWHAVLVLLTLSGLTLYLVFAGVIPLMTWR